MTRTNQQWRLKSRPVGPIKPSDFEWTETRIPDLREGQVLVRVIYLSLDPTNRGWMSVDTYLPAVPLGEVMRGIGIGIVEGSRHPGFQAGDIVQGMVGWQKYLIGDGTEVQKVPPLPGLSLTAHLALLGHIGFTAYIGLLDIGQPRPGETLVVSAAAGAVGSLVGQIGKIHGCRVVGITGTPEKCRYLVEDLGFDAAVNYKTDALEEQILEACPDGIDIDFENVGGKVLDTVLGLTNLYGRIVICGLISQYNATRPVPGPYNFTHILIKRLRVQGFIVLDHMDRAVEMSSRLIQWHREGRLRYRVDMVEGLDQAASAVNRLFEGRNQGKLLVQVSEEPGI